MDIRVLGPVGVGELDGTLGRRDRVVLAALVVRHGEVVTAEALADALWEEEPPRTWSKVVQGCIVRLRHALGGESIETRGNGYRLVAPTEAVDALRFERLVLRARELMALGEPDRAAYAVDEALQLWGGAPWPDLTLWEPAEGATQRLEELRLSAEELRVDAALRTGRAEKVLAEAQSQVKAHPLREHRWTSLALALYQSGRQGEALEVLRRARTVLAEELGIDPGQELVSTERAILQQDPSLEVPTLPQGTAVCPYRGLVPYDVEDAESYFGRNVQVAQCLTRLADQGALAVVGPSGSGKSSLVRAGIAASLEGAGRTVVVITPGARPLDSLAAVPSHGAPVLVVDQCEEVVTLCEDEEQRVSFLRAVAAHVDRGPVVVALRADKLGDFAAYPDFARLVERSLYLLSAMTAAELREAIEAPARQAGLLFEPGLVDLLVHEVEGEPGSLPLLSHALRQTWERREGATLTVAGYKETGGIRGAVAQTAETVYEQAPEEQRRVLRDLLLRLVVPTPEGEPVRSRVARRAVATDTAHEQMIETLVGARLLTSDDQVVQMAHESLARAWPRLRDWLVDDVEGQRVWRHLTVAADAWESMGRPDSELYRGVRLARAVEWRERSGKDLNAVERDFLQASEAAHRSELEREREERVRQAKVNRRLQALVAGVAALALVAVVVGAVAFREADRANEQTAAAEANALVARSHELASAAIGAVDEDPSLAKLLAVSAATTAPTSLQTTSALHQVWAADATVARSALPWGESGWLALNPDGDRMARSGMWFDLGARSLDVVEVDSGEQVWSFDVPTGLGYDAAYLIHPTFSADGSLVAGGAIWEPHHQGREGWERAPEEQAPSDFLGGYLWAADTGQVVERIDLGPCGGVVVAVSEPSLLAMRRIDGAANGCAAFGDEGGGAEVVHVDRSTGEQTVLSEGAIYLVANAFLSDDGLTAAYSDDAARSFTVVDLATGEKLMQQEVRWPDLWGLSGDGSLALVGSEPVEVYDVTSGELLATYAGHGTVVNFARFVPGTETVVSTGNDGALRRWDARTGRELSVYPALGNGAVAPSASGMVAAGQMDDGGTVVVDTGPHGELGELATCPGFVMAGSLQYSVAQDLALVAHICEGASSTVTYGWRPRTQETVFELEGHQGQATAFSPDGSLWVRQDGSGTVRGLPGERGVVESLVVRDTRSGEVVTELDGLCTYVANQDYGACAEFPATPFPLWSWSVRWSPDSRLIAAADEQIGFVVWDAASGDLVHAAHPVSADGSPVGGSRDVHFTPDSAGLLVTTWDGRIFRISTDRWEVETEGRVDNDRVGILGYADDGSLVAVGRFRAQEIGSTLHWLDPETLETRRTVRNLHEGTLRAGALDPSGTRLATVGSEGRARVWDLATGTLVHEVPFDAQLQNVAWVGEDRLAVTPGQGDLVVVTVDPDELLGLVRSSLTRGYTATECATYGFGDDCPVLAQMRGRDAEEDDPGELDGTFTLSWTPEDLETAMLDEMADVLATDKDEASAAVVAERAAELAGDYTLTFDAGRYEIRRADLADAYCSGSYYLRDGQIRLGAERGERCPPHQLFETSYRLDGDTLHLGEEDFTGPWWHRLTWTSRPLVRTAAR